jgi:hypothetical protein
LGSAHAIMKIAGKTVLMNQWMKDIENLNEKCIQSNGKEYAAIKGIANVYKKKRSSTLCVLPIR